jgi:predicted ribosomally synthesized peptide with SipW-like signal peptide
MKKLFLSLLTLGLVSVAAVGATRAYFSDTVEIDENDITTATLEISWDGRRSIYGGGMYFPIELAPGETTSYTDPNGLTHNQRMNIVVEAGSRVPDHLEVQFSTRNFVDGADSGHGSASSRNQYTKMVEVTRLNSYTKTDTNNWQYHGGFLSQVDASLDGDPSFVSLYDLERTVIDEVPTSLERNVIEFAMKMREEAGNKFQGDSLELVVTVGAAQVAGQDVL